MGFPFQIVQRVVIDRGRIARRVEQLAGQVAVFYQDKPLTVVPVLAGALMFAADLVRALPLKMKIGLVGLSSYRGASTSPGTLQASIHLNGDVAGRHVLIVDDVLDSGATLAEATALARHAGAADVRTVVLLDKQRPRTVPVAADWVGFPIGDDFVVGYGLDYNDHYRNLADVVVLKDALYAQDD